MTSKNCDGFSLLKISLFILNEFTNSLAFWKKPQKGLMKKNFSIKDMLKEFQSLYIGMIMDLKDHDGATFTVLRLKKNCIQDVLKKPLTNQRGILR